MLTKKKQKKNFIMEFFLFKILIKRYKLELKKRLESHNNSENINIEGLYENSAALARPLGR